MYGQRTAKTLCGFCKSTENNYKYFTFLRNKYQETGKLFKIQFKVIMPL